MFYFICSSRFIFQPVKNPETTLKRCNNLFRGFISVLFHVVEAALEANFRRVYVYSLVKPVSEIVTDGRIMVAKIRKKSKRSNKHTAQ